MNPLLAKLHVAKHQLGLEEDAYRVMLRRVAGVGTAAKATDAQLIRLIDECRRLGWGGGSARGRDARPAAAKLRALWRSLYALGYVRSPGDGALASYVQRQTGIEALRWTSDADLKRAVDCLKSWCVRVGYKPQADPLGRYEPALVAMQLERVARLGGNPQNLGDWLRAHDYPDLARCAPAQLRHIVELLRLEICKHNEVRDEPAPPTA